MPQREEISGNEFNLSLDPVNPRIVFSTGDFDRVDVNGNDSLAVQGELDCVAARAAKGVDDDGRRAKAAGDVCCSRFRSDRVPSL